MAVRDDFPCEAEDFAGALHYFVDERGGGGELGGVHGGVGVN